MKKEDKPNKKVEKVLEVLGVKQGEVFRIEGSDEKLIIDDKLKVKKIDEHGKEHEAKIKLEDLLTEEKELIKITELTEKEKKLAEGLMIAGYKFIARDMDGDLHAFMYKPYRMNGTWVTGPSAKIECADVFTWLDWEKGKCELEKCDAAAGASPDPAADNAE